MSKPFYTIARKTGLYLLLSVPLVFSFLSTAKGQTTYEIPGIQAYEACQHCLNNHDSNFQPPSSFPYMYDLLGNFRGACLPNSANQIAMYHDDYGYSNLINSPYASFHDLAILYMDHEIFGIDYDFLYIHERKAF
jgi:hypothetical protein